MAEFQAPNGSPIVGIRETIVATAHITGIKDDGQPEYAGRTDVHWDTQVPIVEDGKFVFVDEVGDEWCFDQLVKIKK